jgi:secretion/DNA translocation related TadE-like protein
MTGTALSVGVLAVSVTLAAGIAVAAAASVAQVRASVAADAAALAAADSATGIVSGEPCERAAELAERHGARMAACGLELAVATVVVALPFGPFTVQARARGGPPP